MADYLTAKSRECMRFQFGGVTIECFPDGTVQVFADPERFNVMMTAGRGEGRDTSRLNSRVIVSPIFAQQTGLVGAPPSPPPPVHHNPLAPEQVRAAAPTMLNASDPRVRDLGGPE